MKRVTGLPTVRKLATNSAVSVFFFLLEVARRIQLQCTVFVMELKLMSPKQQNIIAGSILPIG